PHTHTHTLLTTHTHTHSTYQTHTLLTTHTPQPTTPTHPPTHTQPTQHTHTQTQKKKKSVRDRASSKEPSLVLSDGKNSQEREKCGDRKREVPSPPSPPSLPHPNTQLQSSAVIGWTNRQICAPHEQRSNSVSKLRGLLECIDDGVFLCVCVPVCAG